MEKRCNFFFLTNQWDANHGPNNARIYRMAGGGRTGAWSAKTNDKGQWIQVNLGKITTVTKIGIQGRQDYAQWVTSYKVSYSQDGQHFAIQNQVNCSFIDFKPHSLTLDIK